MAAANNKRIRLKQRPLEPVRKAVSYKTELYDGYCLKGLFRELQEDGFSLNRDDFSASISVEYGYYDDKTTYASVSRPETDEELAERQRRYEKDLASYNRWRRENKVAVEEEEQRQKLKRERELKRYANNQKQAKLKEAETLRRKLEKLEKELSK